MQARNHLMNQHQTLVPFLLLALLAHVLVISVIKVMKRAPIQTPLTFDVTILTTKHTQAENKAPAPTTPMTEQVTTKTTGKLIKIKRTQANPGLGAGPHVSEASPVTADLSAAKPVEKVTEKPKLDVEELLASARRITIEDAKNLPIDNIDNTPLADRVFSPELAKALAFHKKVAGTTQLAGGMVKVVTTDGNEYCLQPSPMLNKGAFENDPIPMTCP